MQEIFNGGNQHGKENGFEEDHDHRFRPHRHRSGCGVRLRRHPGLPGAEGGGLRGGAGELQPRHDHDRHRHRGQGVHGAADPGVRGAHPALRAPGRDHPRHRRSDGSESGHAAGEEGRAEGVPGGASGHQQQEHRARRGSRAVQGAVPGDRRAGHSLQDHLLRGGGRGGSEGDRLPGGAAPCIHPGRYRRRLRLQ